MTELQLGPIATRETAISPISQFLDLILETTQFLNEWDITEEMIKEMAVKGLNALQAMKDNTLAGQERHGYRSEQIQALYASKIIEFQNLIQDPLARAGWLRVNAAEDRPDLLWLAQKIESENSSPLTT